jgi:hypothetical protein
MQKKHKKYDNSAYYKTKRGVLSLAYSHQQGRKRIPLLYTRKEFIEKYMNDDKLDSLLEDWKLSGYNKWKKPSFDRIDNKGPYSFENLQIISWEENDKKGAVERSVKIEMFSLDGVLIKVWGSFKEINIFFNTQAEGNITLCCNGKQKKSRGYKWEWYDKSRRKP